MYKYAAIDSIFDGISNIHLFSIATAFLAVIIAFYCSNLLKDDDSKPLQDAEDEEYDYERNENQYVEGSRHDQELENLNELVDVENDEDEDDYDSHNGGNHKYNNCQNSDSDDVDEENGLNGEYHQDGLVSKMKTKRIKQLEAQLTQDQLEEERRIEREQLAAIFDLLKKQEAELNMKEIDEHELNAQLNLYR